jgi:uncharacterized protein YbaA (DUF1428 family)
MKQYFILFFRLNIKKIKGAKMSKYVDGFLLPIAAENIEKYREIAQVAGEIWKEHGALEYIEAVGDDLDIEKMVSFKKSADAQDGETVIFAFIVFESKAERDRINALVMADKRLEEACSPDGKTFDYTRMSYGGFQVLVEA